MADFTIQGPRVERDAKRAVLHPWKRADRLHMLRLMTSLG